MTYAKYIDIPNWKDLQQQIIEFKYASNVDSLWWMYTPKEIEKYLPDVYNTFSDMGLQIRQLILFDNLPNNLTETDTMKSECMFIHTDREDDPESQYDNVPVLTDFVPSYAINIPLENCKDSLTFWYELNNPNEEDVYYKFYDCGGHRHDNCKEVFRLELDKPAVLKIDSPHAVYNPHNELRTVATIRFYNDLSYLLD